MFKEVFDIFNNKAHLSKQGLNQIINIKASMNLGLSDFLKSEFNKFTPVKRQIIKTESIPVRKRLIGLQALSQGMGVLTLKSLNSKQII